MTNKTGWWYRASKEQRLEQIRAGIELGMTSKQVAMNCGCYYEGITTTSAGDAGGSLVAGFATRHGSPFPVGRTDAASRRMRDMQKLHHEVRRTHDQTDVSEAFDIFGVRSSRNDFTSIFETVGDAA